MVSNIVINEVGQQGIKAIIKAVNTPEVHKLINETAQQFLSFVVKGR